MCDYDNYLNSIDQLRERKKVRLSIPIPGRRDHCLLNWRNFPLPGAEYQYGTHVMENYIKISRYFDLLCFIYQLIVISCR